MKRAWRAYWASIPQAVDTQPPDGEGQSGTFGAPPLEGADLEAFAALAGHVVAHLPATVAAAKGRQLKARFKAGVEPAEALARWIGANSKPASRVGVMALDWKAREEVAWQARNLAAAHGVELAWNYDLEADTVWQGWQARDEAPVDTPLKGLAQALRGVGLVLCSFGVDDSVFAFAVAAPRAASVQSLCGSLGVQLRLPT